MADPGDRVRVRVRPIGDGVPQEPIATDVDAWFAELDRFADVPFLDTGGSQDQSIGHHHHLTIEAAIQP